METDFNSVDVLTMALSAVRMLRSSGDTEAALENAYVALGLKKPDSASPLAIRIVQLILDAGPNRSRLYDYLRRIEGPLSWCRPINQSAPNVGGLHEDPEAKRYLELLKAGQLGPKHSMFWRSDAFPYFSSFRLLERTAVKWFDGPTVVVRNGQKINPWDAVPQKTGDVWKSESLDLPSRATGLIHYPLEVPTLFNMDIGHSPWDVWEICNSFAAQYMKLYEQPARYGVWGHDLSELWLEDLIYYPNHQLIEAVVGS